MVAENIKNRIPTIERWQMQQNCNRFPRAHVCKKINACCEASAILLPAKRGEMIVRTRDRKQQNQGENFMSFIPTF